MKEIKIVKHVNSTTQQQQQSLYIFIGLFNFLLSLGGNNRYVCHGLSRNLLLDFVKMCPFKRLLIDHSLISPEQKWYQLKAHL